MSNALPGLKAALVLAQHQYEYHLRQSQDDKNPEQYEDACCATAARRICDRLESAIAEAERQQQPAVSWSEYKAARGLPVRMHRPTSDGLPREDEL